MSRSVTGVLLLSFLGAAHPCAGEERRLEVGPDAILRVTLTGQGDPVVLIPSAFASAFAYRKVVAELNGAGRAAVVIEPLGVGGSSRPARADYSFTAQAERVAAAMTALGVPRAVVVAQAAASSIALRLAIAHPERVTAVVSVEGGAAEAALTGGLRRALHFAPLLKLFGGLRLVRRAVRSALTDGAGDPHWVTDAVIAGYMPPPEVDFDALMRAWQGMAKSREPAPLQPRLGAVACPVRLLIGALPHRGGIDPPEIHILETGLRRLTVLRIAGAGHFINEEDPGAVRQAVEDAARDALTAPPIPGAPLEPGPGRAHH